MADVAAEEAAIETEERELIHSIFEFGDTVVREVMVPRPDMVAVEADATVDEAIALAISAGKSRLPAFDDSTDNIVGLVFLKDLVARSGSGRGQRAGARQLAAAALRARVEARRRAAARDADREVPHGDRRRRVRRHRRPRHDGGPARGDRRRDHRRVRRRGTAGRAARRTARCASPAAPRSTRSNELLDVELPQDEWDTVGGLVFNTLGHVPVEGECVRVDGLEFCAERVQGRRIVSVLIRVLEPHERRRRGPRPQRPRVTAASRPGFRSGFVVDRRAAERRQVDAREPARRAQGVDRLRPAADDAHADARRAHDRDATQIVFLDTPGVHKPRTLARRAHERPRAVDARRGRRRSASCRGERGDRPGRPVRRRRSSRRCARRRCSSSTRSTRASRDDDRRAPGGGRGRARRLRGVRADLGAHRRRRRRARSASSRPGCPRVRTTTRTASSAISPSRSSRPSSCARSCSRWRATSCRTRSR